MRVITGSAKGKRLDTLEGLDIRPTTDRVKEAIFSSIQFDIFDSEVLDLFAGTGQLGIEAISRGAKSAVFVDNSKRSLDVVKKNLEKTGFTNKSTIINMNSFDYAKTMDKKFDFIFLDPPYNMGILTEILPVLSNKVTPDGKIICEYEKNLDLPEKIGDLRLKKVQKYGKIKVSVYCHNREDE
ncbi:MAG: 16S rRNA (guanine(966)-N(2))-methyltransferase RsmD [Porcipelethomonas sp.]